VAQPEVRAREGLLGMSEPTRQAGPPPLIGVSTYLEAARWGNWVREAALLPAPYIRAVDRAGGVPVLLPPTTARNAKAAVRGLDGIVLAGGGDLEPGLYGAKRHGETTPPQPARDRYEFALVRAAIEADKPFLGICRGIQVLNVARDGDLVQHLPEAVGHDGHAPVPGKMASHEVRISLASELGKIMGERADVPTYHHQAIRRLGKGLVAVAWTDDQVVEAVELQGHRFGLAVQWHPEEDDEDTRLLEAFVAAAAGR
jgi:putative glutamine amidotransferase